MKRERLNCELGKVYINWMHAQAPERLKKHSDNNNNNNNNNNKLIKDCWRN
jgi:hypothetical protein